MPPPHPASHCPNRHWNPTVNNFGECRASRPTLLRSILRWLLHSFLWELKIIHDRLRLETESRERQFNELERARKAWECIYLSLIHATSLPDRLHARCVSDLSSWNPLIFLSIFCHIKDGR
jgi:hypothetical protein